MSEVNAEFLKLVVKELESDLSRWDQQDWTFSPQETRLTPTLEIYDTNACGTTFCLAGMAVHKAGYYVGTDMVSKSFGVFDQDGKLIGGQSQVARELLGLDMRQTDILFSGAAGAGDFENFKRLITKETGVTFDD